MNSILSKKYAFLGKNPIKEQKTKFGIRSIAKNNTLLIILFCAIMAVVGYLAVEKIIPDIIPYSWNSAFASTFSYAISAIGFCLLMGYSGLASLGTGGFIGIGMLSVYYIMNESDLPFLLAVLVAIVVAVVLGIIVGFISLRIEGIYLVILTLGLSEILRQVYVALGNKFSLSSYPEIFGIKIIRTYSLYVVLVFLAIVMIVISNLINSPTGRAMLAMKNSTAAAQAMGISLMKYRLLAFVICTLCASISGSLLMMVLRTATAEDTGIFGLLTSLNILAAVIIGGYKSIWGTVFGTFVMYGLQTIVLNNIPFFAENPVIITFISGILVIIVVMFYPGGLAQLVSELKVKIKGLRKKMREAKYGKDLG